jgi:alkylation response protein AidB-like acyl-CoA dehydrogenase
MDLRISQHDAQFRADVRAFIATALPDDIARRGKHDYHSAREDVSRWMKILNRKGWSAPHWPARFGGADWSPLQKYIFQDELRLARAPVLDRCALDLLGPVLCAFGSSEQQARFLPPILNGDEWWCQGFSEPGSGSDLASLRTRADLEGDHYIVNGSKIWTTEAHYADWVFALVRTDQTVKPQTGISFLLIDMKSPGLERRPIWAMDEGLTLNELFFDNVRVPACNLVGEAGKGWDYAKFLLTHERTTSAVVSHTKRDVQQIRHLAALAPCGSGKLLDDPGFALRLARLEADVMALEWAVMRVLHADEHDAAGNSVASLLKLRGSELSERAALLAADALGDHGIAAMPDPEGQYRLYSDGLFPPLYDDEAIGVSAKAMFRRATTIYGGTSEIQRGIIAKSILKL